MATLVQIHEGLEILIKYSPSGPCDAQHDCIYVMGDYDTVSEEDKKTLDGLGWIWDEEADSWKHFT